MLTLCVDEEKPHASRMRKLGLTARQHIDLVRDYTRPLGVGPYGAHDPEGAVLFRSVRSALVGIELLREHAV
jgi:hypothetical protein